MPIHWRLKTMLKRREMTAYALAKELGITNSAAYKLVRHPTAPRLSPETLDALCRVLKCQPGDLLEYRKS